MFAVALGTFLIASSLLGQSNIFLRCESKLAGVLSVNAVLRNRRKLSQIAAEFVAHAGALRRRLCGGVILEDRLTGILAEEVFELSECDFALTCCKFLRMNSLRNY